MHLFFRFLRRCNRPQFDSMYARFKEGKRRLNSCDREGHSLLHHAVLEDRPQEVKRLIELRADQNIKSCFGSTALHYAQLLDRKSCLAYFSITTPKRSLLIYRNADQKIHTISTWDFEQKVGISYLDILLFENAFDIKWIERKCHHHLRKKNIRQMNRWMCALHEEKLTQFTTHQVYIRWIDHDLGYGVFAAEDLPALTYIGEYAGVVTMRTWKR